MKFKNQRNIFPRKLNRFLILFLFLTLSSNVFSQKSPAQLHFLEDKVNFGKINSGRFVNHEFKFVNTGETPIIISEVTHSCGCIAVFYPRQPILKGDTAKILTRFNSTGKVGKQHKIIYIYSNAENSPQKLHFKCNVVTK